MSATDMSATDMSATESVRNRHISRSAAIDDSASGWEVELAHLKDEARQRIIEGFDPHTGAKLTIEQHAVRLDEIEAWGSERDIYYLRLEKDAEANYGSSLAYGEYMLYVAT